MTLEFVFFLMTCFTFPTLSWKSWHIWPARSVFFLFLLFTFFCATCSSSCCNSLQQLLQADFHRAQGPHFFLLHLGSWCCQSPASWAHVLWVFPWITTYLGRGGFFQTSCGDQSVKDLHGPPTSGKTFLFTVREFLFMWSQMHIRPKLSNRRAGKTASAFKCAFICSRNCMDTYPTFLAVMWCAGLCLSQG